MKFTSSMFLLLLSFFANAEKGIIATQKYFDANTSANITVTWYVTESNCKMKMEFSDGMANSVNWFIAAAANAQLLTYTEGAVPSGVAKTYFTIPIQNIKGDKVLGTSRVKVQKTGETKSLSGFNCEKLIVTTGQNTTEMWVTKDFSAGFFKFASFFQSSFELAGLSEERIGGFPLQSTTSAIGGKVINSYSLISASSSELNATDFTVPAENQTAEKGKN